MTYSAQTRDRFRLAVVAVTGLTGVAALSTTGWLAGTAAHGSEALEQEQAAVAQAKHRSDLAAWRKATVAAQQQQRRPRVVVRDRPHRTETTVQYVQATGTSAVGTGGQVAAAPAASSAQQSVQLPSAPAAAPAPAPAQPARPAPAPPPPPPPAPSSGS